MKYKKYNINKQCSEQENNSNKTIEREIQKDKIIIYTIKYNYNRKYIYKLLYIQYRQKFKKIITNNNNCKEKTN